MDQYGYLRITDLGISKIHNENNSQDSSGTPGYMSPEVKYIFLNIILKIDSLIKIIIISKYIKRLF